MRRQKAKPLQRTDLAQRGIPFNSLGRFLQLALLEDLSRVPDPACNFDTCSLNSRGEPGGAALYSFGLRRGGAPNSPGLKVASLGYSFGVDLACSVLHARLIRHVSFLLVI